MIHPTPILACGPSGDIVFIYLAIMAGLWISGVLALVNPIVLLISKSSPSFKSFNLVLYSIYVAPGIVWLLEASNHISSHIISEDFFIKYTMVAPLITASHLVFLIWKRQKLQAILAEQPALE